MFLEHDLLTVILMKQCSHNYGGGGGGGGGKSIPEGRHEITWNASTLSHLDQHTNQCELEVKMIIHLQNLANQLPDAFVDTKKVTKSHIPAANVPAQVDITEEQKAYESKTRSKRGRPNRHNSLEAENKWKSK